MERITVMNSSNNGISSYPDIEYRQLPTERINPESVELDKMSVAEAAALMNRMDREVADAVGLELNTIAEVAEAAAQAFKAGGRLIYVGAGTSGRLGVLDASECVPTFGVSSDTVIGKIAGGDRALRYAVEGAEDDPLLGRADMEELKISDKDLVIAISASGSAAYCQGALLYAREHGAKTAGISCVKEPRFGPLCDYSISVVVGPEILTGSTRLRAGTATKMVLNMISTLSMVQIGKVYRNYMVDVVPSNKKLIDRAARIVTDICGIGMEAADELIRRCNGEIKTAIVCHKTGAGADEARRVLAENGGSVRAAIDSLSEIGGKS